MEKFAAASHTETYSVFTPALVGATGTSCGLAAGGRADAGVVLSATANVVTSGSKMIANVPYRPTPSVAVTSGSSGLSSGYSTDDTTGATGAFGSYVR
jgi:hypothetical protein